MNAVVNYRLLSETLFCAPTDHIFLNQSTEMIRAWRVHELSFSNNLNIGFWESAKFIAGSSK